MGDFFAGIQQQAGSTVFAPAIIFLLSILLGLGAVKAFRAAATIGVGLVGVSLVMGIVWRAIAPALQSLFARFGHTGMVLDVSWPVSAAVAFSTVRGVLIIPLTLAVNYLMLTLRLTKTVNVDIWNYWHYALSGSVIGIMTGSMLYGFLCAACHCIVSLKLADISARLVQREFEIPNVSVPHGISCALLPLFLVLEKLYTLFGRRVALPQHTPKMGKTARFLTEPLTIGVMMGSAIGLLQGMPLVQSLQLGVYMAALMLLLPRIVKIIMEGLIPISQALRRFTEKRFGGKELYIGVDSAVVLGHPTTVYAAGLLIPIVVVLSLVLPGNNTLPLGDIPYITFFIAMATPVHKGSLWRTLVSGTVALTIMLPIAGYFAPAYTLLVQDAAGGGLQGQGFITSLSIGNPLPWLFAQMLALPGWGMLAVAAFTAVVTLLCIAYERRMESQQNTPLWNEREHANENDRSGLCNGRSDFFGNQ